MPATRAVYQVIIVWLQRFIICTDWVTTNGKGQAPLTRRSPKHISAPAACLPSLSSERANCKCICLRRRRTAGSRLHHVPLRRHYQCSPWHARPNPRGSHLGTCAIILIPINQEIKSFYCTAWWKSLLLALECSEHVKPAHYNKILL